jgi:hypothetical protein
MASTGQQPGSGLTAVATQFRRLSVVWAEQGLMPEGRWSNGGTSQIAQGPAGDRSEAESTPWFCGPAAALDAVKKRVTIPHTRYCALQVSPLGWYLHDGHFNAHGFSGICVCI